jgi:outer membrane protein OmpA-like peptidoglycan-associated protein
MCLIFSQRAGRWCVVTFAFGIAGLVLQAHAQADKASGADGKPKYGVSKPLGDTYAGVKSVADEQTRIVLYRPSVPDTAGVVSVYLNGRYHASLQKEAFTVVCLSGKKTDVRTRYLPNQSTDIRPELDTYLAIAINGGQSVYLRITEGENTTSRIDLVAPQVALKDLTDAHQQMHTLSRVPGAQACREAEETRFAFDPNIITFGSDAIFEHKKTDIHAISTQGRQELQQIVEKINIKYKTFKTVKVHVVGFADDEADDVLNRRISQQRAQSVRAFFKAQGLRSTALTHEGRGSEEKQKAQLFGLSPRRVEVEVAVELR